MFKWIFWHYDYSRQIHNISFSRNHGKVCYFTIILEVCAYVFSILAQNQRSRGAWLLWWSTGSRFRYTLHIRIILADFGLILTRLSHFLVPFFLDFSNIYSFFVTLAVAGQIFPACNIANLKWNFTSWKYCIAGWKYWFAGWKFWFAGWKLYFASWFFG